MAPSIHLLVLLLVASTASALPHGSRKGSSTRSGQGRNIQPLPCQDKNGDRGVCMFAWNCAEAGGTHLGTCVDRFYFGSCCKLPEALSADDLKPALEDLAANPDVGEAVAAPALIIGSTSSPSTTTEITSTEEMNTSSSTSADLTSSTPADVTSSTHFEESTTPTSSTAEEEPIEMTTLSSENEETTLSEQDLQGSEESVESAEDTKLESTTALIPFAVEPVEAEEEIIDRPQVIDGPESPAAPVGDKVDALPESPVDFPVNEANNELPEEDGDIWNRKMSQEKMERMLLNATTSEVCGRRPWKNVIRHNKIYPEGHLKPDGFSDAPIGKLGRRNSKFLWWNDDDLKRSGRIVQGDVADYGEWPWQVSLRQMRTGTYIHKCGCTLLSENWAITAAHCVEDARPDDLLVRMGEYNLGDNNEPEGHIDRKVQIIAAHPKFDAKTYEYDLALLRFYEPIEFQPNVIPICVPSDDRDLVGETAWVTGWGRLYSQGPLPSVLQEVNLPIISNSQCEQLYENAGYKEYIPNIFICAGYQKGGQDSCEGDSGGPMSVQREDGRFMLSGIISWGIGCAEENQPGVYTRVSEFRDWIQQIIQY